MNTFKRILSGVLAAAMTIGAASAISVNAANVTFTDVASDHWAWTNGSIPYLVEKGVINGYKQDNGTYTFQPSSNVTRAEFIKMLDEVFGLEETAQISFADMKSEAWFYPYFQKAAAQGYLLDYGTNANPDGAIPREEAIALLVRYLDLPANEKAEASKFADYSTISDSYKEYVLRAIYANLINGYEEDGKTYFKPKNTLTRAEALTILYRAAGCIFDKSAYSRETTAPETNNVITEGGITINNVRFNGRTIISEGVDNGRVTFTDCDINGTLYIRGGADVTFDDCTVENVIVFGGGDISLVSDTVIDSMTLEAKSDIGIYSGTKIKSMSVEFGCDNVRVSGDGTLDKVYINARNFSSSMAPTEFEIGNNLTATFNGKTTEGTSDTQNAFTLEPFSTADNQNHYINLISSVDAKVYYYYTSLSNKPTVSSFESYYESAAYSGNFSVGAGKAESAATFSSSAVKSYEYVVLQIRDDNRKYAPVIIPNHGETGTGFSTDPYLDDELTIKFKSANSATIYWYYADDGIKITPIEFLDAYADKESALKGEESVTSLKSFTCTLKEKYLENYGYVAFMLKTNSGVYYTPVIVSVGDNGFAELPVVKTPGELTFKSSVSGDIYYYYSETDDLPSADNFKAEYNAAKYRDNESVRANVSQEIDFNLSRVDQYPYMILSIRNSEGDYLQPVSVDINFTTGFDIEPYIKSSSEIRLRTKDDGKVQYYYTKSSIAPSVDQFSDGYSDQSSKYRGELSVGVYTETIEYSISSAVTYPYMAIMFIDEDGKKYSPVLLELDATLDTGFSIAPYADDGRVYFRTTDDGEVWYYYTDESDSVAAADFEEYYDGESSRRRGTVEVKGGTTDYITVDDDILEDYPYLVIAFTDEPDSSSPDFCFPFVIDVEESELSDAGTGLEIGTPDDDNEVRITALYEGTLYYYRTNDEDDLPSSASEFRSKYGLAEESDEEDFDEDDWEYIDFNDYDYLVCSLKVGSTYLEPVVIHYRDGADIDDDDDDDDENLPEYDKNGNGFTITGTRANGWTFIADVSGTLTLYAQNSDGSLSTVKSVDCTKNEDSVFELPSFTFIVDGLMFSNTDFYLQLTNTSGEKYEAMKIDIFD